MKSRECPCAVLTSFFLFFWGDCGCRDWYDSPQSTLRPHTGVTQCMLVPDVCKFCVWMGGAWLWQRQVWVVLEGPCCCMFIVPSFGCFVSPGIGRVYTMPTAAEQLRGLPAHPSKVHSSPWCIRSLTWCTWLDTYQYWQSALITAQAPLFLSVMTCHSLKRTQANPLYLSENLIS